MTRPHLRLLTALLAVGLMLVGCTTPRHADHSLTIQLQPIPDMPANVIHETVYGTMVWPFGWGMDSKVLGRYATDEHGRVHIENLALGPDRLIIRHPDHLEVHIGGSEGSPFTAFYWDEQLPDHPTAGVAEGDHITVQMKPKPR